MKFEDLRIGKKYKLLNHSGYVYIQLLSCSGEVYIYCYSIDGKFIKYDWANFEELREFDTENADLCPDCGGRLEWSCMAMKCVECWRVI